MCKTRCSLSIAMVFMSMTTINGWSHPHMTFDASVEFEMKDRTCSALHVELLFDPMFSASIIMEFDKNRDGEFSAAEATKLRVGAFDNLKNYGYFVYLRKGERRFQPGSIAGFSPYIKKGLLVYRFKISLEGKNLSDDFSVAIFDSTYYCQVCYPASPAKAYATAGSTLDPSFRIELVENKKYPVYYNPYGDPTDHTVYTSWASGLDTAFPQEIRLSYRY